MTRLSTEELIDALAAEAPAARPLPSPWRRALAALAAIALAGLISILVMADPATLLGRYRGREEMMALEMLAALATGVLALTAAFFLAIPGRSGKWLLTPLLPLLAWLGLSGLGCYRDLVRGGSAGFELGHGADCLLFIVGTSLILAGPIAWLLSRARPIEPLPVALAASLGIAALAAFLLQFFHPFAVTFLDLGIHVAAILLVVGLSALLNRRALAPA